MVNSEKKSSSSISPSSPQLAIIFLTSPSMVAAWPFICSPRSAELCSISLRRSGLASNTTPLPKIGVMNGYASAWSRSSSAERKKNSLASAPDSKMTCLSTSWNQPTSPHSSRMRCIKPIGSVRNSSRWPCSSSPPDTRGTIAVWRSLSGHPFFAECEFLAVRLVSANGASGWSSMFAMKPPRGVSATNVMARPRSAARRK